MMRVSMLVFIVALAGCTLAAGKLDKPTKPNPIGGDSIEVTKLDAPPGAAAATKPLPRPVQSDGDGPKTAASAEPEVVPTTPKPAEPQQTKVVSPEELACVKQGGTWSGAGFDSAKSCVRLTKDGGKSCHKESDCEGYCLARSGTCAPAKPMFGCNDILQENGAMATLCID